MTNPVVRIVVELVWMVAFALIPVDASYDARAFTATTAQIDDEPPTPSSARFRSWLALRLTSPPSVPRMTVA